MPEFVDGKPIIPSVLMRDKSQDKSQLYQGNCHCGAVVYKVNLIPPFPEHLVIRCNCSKCSKNGNMNVYPERKHVEWIRGSDTLKGYKFGSKENTYMFCGTCGNNVMIVIDPELARKHGQPEVLAMNVSQTLACKFRKANLKSTTDTAELGTNVQGLRWLR